MRSNAIILDRTVRITCSCQSALTAVWPRLVVVMEQVFDDMTCSMGLGHDWIDELQKRQTCRESRPGSLKLWPSARPILRGRCRSGRCQPSTWATDELVSARVRVARRNEDLQAVAAFQRVAPLLGVSCIVSTDVDEMEGSLARHLVGEISTDTPALPAVPSRFASSKNNQPAG